MTVIDDAAGVRGTSCVRAASLVVATLTIGMVAGLVWVLFIAHPRFSLNTFIGDDAGYYFAIARNACLGFGISFDRLHATNGFNPLETLVLLAVDRVFVPGLGIL